MKLYRRRAFVIVKAETEEHAVAMFEAIDGIHFDPSHVPGYDSGVGLIPGPMEEIVVEEVTPSLRRLRVV